MIMSVMTAVCITCHICPFVVKLFLKKNSKIVLSRKNGAEKNEADRKCGVREHLFGWDSREGKDHGKEGDGEDANKDGEGNTVDVIHLLMITSFNFSARLLKMKSLTSFAVCSDL